jgi:hypothetical protein
MKDIGLGKQLPDAIYVAQDNLCYVPKPMSEYIQDCIDIHYDDDTDTANLFKIFTRSMSFTALWYEGLGDVPHPYLKMYCKITKQTYDQHEEDNYKKTKCVDRAPILHRTETMINRNHPNFLKLQDITTEEEDFGLYENTCIIGYRHKWNDLVEKKVPECLQYRYKA